MNLKTRKNNFAPRLGLTYLLTEDSRTILRTGYGITYFPVAASASNLLGQQVPYTISQNVNPEVNPTNWANVRSIDNPFPPIQQVKPQTTAELNAANPRVLGHGFENETPSAQQWHLGVERQLFGPVVAEIGYIGSAGKHLLLCWNPNEVQPGTGTQASRRLLQPLSNAATIIQCDPRNRSTFHGLQTRVNQRFTNGFQLLFSYTWGKSLDYGGSAASGGGQTGNPQTVTNMDAGKGPSGFDVRHRAVISSVYELPWGPNRPWLNQGGLLSAIVGGWQASSIITATTGRPFNVSLAAGVNNGAPSWPNRTGSGELDNPTVDLWFNPADFVAPPPNTYGDVGRGVLYSPGHLNFDLSLAKRFFMFGGRTNAQVAHRSRSTCSTIRGSASRTPRSARRPSAASRSTVVDNRSMQFAVKFDF